MLKKPYTYESFYTTVGETLFFFLFRQHDYAIVILATRFRIDVYLLQTHCAVKALHRIRKAIIDNRLKTALKLPATRTRTWRSLWHTNYGSGRNRLQYWVEITWIIDLIEHTTKVWLRTNQWQGVNAFFWTVQHERFIFTRKR